MGLNYKVERKAKELSDLIAVKSATESQCYPIDRYFLEPYIQPILGLDRTDFLLYNFELVNTNYTIHLMLCLPELWEDISVDDLVALMERFSNTFSFYALINFSYRYIEIDILSFIFKIKSLPSEYIFQLKEYLKTQYPNFIKTESDYLFFDEGIWGVKNEQWMYIKQKFLLDKRVKPALKSLDELKLYIDILTK